MHDRAYQHGLRVWLVELAKQRNVARDEVEPPVHLGQREDVAEGEVDEDAGHDHFVLLLVQRELSQEVLIVRALLADVEVFLELQQVVFQRFRLEPELSQAVYLLLLVFSTLSRQKFPVQLLQVIEVALEGQRVKFYCELVYQLLRVLLGVPGNDSVRFRCVL